MSKRTAASTWKGISALIVILTVFGLTALMILERYQPAVITTVVSTTSLAAAELVRRLREPPRRNTTHDHGRESAP